MKKLVVMAFALTFVLGTTVSFAQNAPKTDDTKKEKKSKKKKTDTTDTTKK